MARVLCLQKWWGPKTNSEIPSEHFLAHETKMKLKKSTKFHTKKIQDYQSYCIIVSCWKHFVKKIHMELWCVSQNCTLMVSAAPVSYLIIFVKREGLLTFFQWLILQQGQLKDDNLLRWTFHKFDKNFKVYFFQRNRISSASLVHLHPPSCMKDD